jgi:hypothetical protein
MGLTVTRDSWAGEIAQLKSRIARLENSPQLIASSVKEGAFVTLDASGNQRVLIGKDPSDSSYGVKIYDAFGNPLLTNDAMIVKDAAAVTRVKVGKLDATPTYGLAWYDSAGVLIGDTTGLNQALKEIATFDVNPQNQTFNFTPTSGQDSAHALDITTVTSGSFTLARPADVLILTFLTARISAGATFAYAQYVIKSGSTVVAGPYYNGLWDSRNAGYNSFGGWTSPSTLAAGTYTAVFQCYGDNGVAFEAYSGHGSIFRLGK